MRKSGAAKADKKAGRVAADGAIKIKVADDGKKAVIVEINSETDFVAKDENFQQFADAVTEAVFDHEPADIEAVGSLTLASGETVEQARLVADRLEAMPLEFTSLQASTMTRARQTGEIIAASFPALELVLHRDIRECTPSTRREDIMADLEPGEAEECEANLEAAWSRIFLPVTGDGNEYDIVVCHGNVIRWFATRVLEVDPLAWLQMSIANCSLTVVQVHADGSKKLIAFAERRWLAVTSSMSSSKTSAAVARCTSSPAAKASSRPLSPER